MSVKNLTRREVIKKIAIGALGTSLLPNILSANIKPKITFPNIISRRSGIKPNFLFILQEGTPLSIYSCYGSYRMQTPNIDRLASEGMRFENAFVSNALCSPSRGTLLTGTYSHLNGLPDNANGPAVHNNNSDRLKESVITFPEILKENGYFTGAVGKWHLGCTPRGFDYWKVTYGAGGDYDNPTFYEKPEKGSIEEKNLNKVTFGGTQKQYSGYSTDISTDMAIEFMKKYNKGPFCMIFSPEAVHSQFEPPDKYKNIYDNERVSEPGTFWDDYKNRSSAARDAHLRIEYMADRQFYNHIAKERPENLTDKQRKQWNYQRFIKNFMGTMRSNDDNVGRLLQYLDESGLRDNTIVILTSDHGFFLGEHGWFDKRFMYEEAIRVPWIIRYPGEIKSGSTTPTMTVNIDNAPTILDLAGIPVPKEMQGQSLKPIFEGKTPKDWRTSMYYHYYEFAPPHWVEPHYGVRTDRYTLINYYNINEWELFDRKYDPDEMDSLFKMGGYKIQPQYENIVPSLVKELEHLRKLYNDNTGASVHLWPTRSYN